MDKNAQNRWRAPEFEPQIFYGQLDFIVICTLPASRAVGLTQPTTYVLSLVQTCESEPLGGDAAKEVVCYSNSTPAIFMNLNVIQCVVGRIHIGKRRWGIVDRSGDYI